MMLDCFKDTDYRLATCVMFLILSYTLSKASRICTRLRAREGGIRRITRDRTGPRQASISGLNGLALRKFIARRNLIEALNGLDSKTSEWKTGAAKPVVCLAQAVRASDR